VTSPFTVPPGYMVPFQPSRFGEAKVYTTIYPGKAQGKFPGAARTRDGEETRAGTAERRRLRHVAGAGAPGTRPGSFFPTISRRVALPGAPARLKAGRPFFAAVAFIGRHARSRLFGNNP
jgi:hypothetical protein